ncbi:hypothetical protein CF327_g5272 [Tilletia walkeri]|uniref:Uncharacterized protein n=1 Tax=Tilletia walkeri TaxID=117179 RepID=A0A8X7N2I9_9BASI|nr:hypothetical protein CF327_g5272 [Tilletia walkeri]KAE8263925.1 hypothetical protein A4X09_0g7100 [Tilletia walkeri]
MPARSPDCEASELAREGARFAVEENYSEGEQEEDEEEEQEEDEPGGQSLPLPDAAVEDLARALRRAAIQSLRHSSLRDYRLGGDKCAGRFDKEHLCNNCEDGLDKIVKQTGTRIDTFTPPATGRSTLRMKNRGVVTASRAGAPSRLSTYTRASNQKLTGNQHTQPTVDIVTELNGQRVHFKNALNLASVDLYADTDSHANCGARVISAFIFALVSLWRVSRFQEIVQTIDILVKKFPLALICGKCGTSIEPFPAQLTEPHHSITPRQ